MVENNPSASASSSREIPIFRRLVGQETEYLIRFHSENGGAERVSNSVLYESLTRFVSDRVPIAPHMMADLGWYTANGGSFHFERIFLLDLIDPMVGLIEGGTPECRNPEQLLRYQRAQDVLLSQAMANAVSDHDLHGHQQSATLVKNNRDIAGAQYGSHENYEATIAGPWVMPIWKVLIYTLVVVVFPLALCLLFLIVMASMAYSLLKIATRHLPNGETFLRSGITVVQWLLAIGVFPLIAIPWFVIWLTAFRRQRRHLLAYLVSRPIFCGAGFVDKRGELRLSSRARAIGTVVSLASEVSRPIFYFGHILKTPSMIFAGDTFAIRDLLKPRQRLQIACGDSNMTQQAEYLKFGVTSLILDAIENGYLDKTPRLLFPLSAFRLFCKDTTLTRKTVTTWGRLSAREIQNIYLESCRRMLDDHPSPPAEAERVWRLWSETLDALENDRESLTGKVDWITKEYLLREETDRDVRRKIDMRYHELSQDGYYLQLEGAGGALTLIDPEDVLTAIQEPPEDTPAERRGKLIREHEGLVTVSWTAARILGSPEERVKPLASG